MLPDRIELSTSPLPMECSTTELRQRAPEESAEKASVGAGRSLPQGQSPCKRGVAGAALIKGAENQLGDAPACFRAINSGPIRFPIRRPAPVTP